MQTKEMGIKYTEDEKILAACDTTRRETEGSAEREYALVDD